MHPSLHHGWDLSRDDARRLQRALASEVIREDELPEVLRVAGIHFGYPRTASGAVTGLAAIVLMTLPDLALAEQRLVRRTVTFPYIPGLRSFRETPLAIAALEALSTPPDLLMVSGHGVAHPERFGVASHIGVVLDLPTVGCSTSAPVGWSQEPGEAQGASSPIRHQEEIVGAALRTRTGSRPVYISVGHRVSLETATALVMRCTRGRRLPEPLRLAAELAASPPEARPS